MAGRRAVATQVTTRRWHIPPPLLHGSGAMEGAAVLAELPGPAGLLLWQALRDVMLWAEVPQAEAAGLFAPGAATARQRALRAAGMPERLAAPMAVLGSILADPVAADGEAIGAACTAIAAWAEEEGLLATALAFGQDAAIVRPDDPEPALEVARLATRLADHSRAELWYRRVTGIARRAKAWRPYAHSFSGLGRLYHDRGNLPAAQRYHARALAAARRGGLRLERAIALHDLFGVAVDAGRTAEAEHYAREALAAYPRNDPRLAALARDVAYFWMESGHFSRALSVLQAVAPLVASPADRLVVEADLMRAAAGSGAVAEARRAARRVREMSAGPEQDAAAARAWLALARGEQQLGDWDAAASAAAEAHRIAREYREGRTVLMTEALIEAIEAGRVAGGGRRPARRRKPLPPSPQDEALAARLIDSLKGLEPALESSSGVRPEQVPREADAARHPETRARQ